MKTSNTHTHTYTHTHTRTHAHTHARTHTHTHTRTHAHTHTHTHTHTNTHTHVTTHKHTGRGRFCARHGLAVLRRTAVGRQRAPMGQAWTPADKGGWVCVCVCVRICASTCESMAVCVGGWGCAQTFNC